MQLEQGLATDTVIVSPGRSLLSSGTGQGAGISAAISSDTSDFKLFINDTATVSAASPDIEASIAIIQKVVYVQSENSTFTINVNGVDFAKYAEFYSSTFVADSGSISLSPENDTVVIGRRLHDPWKNDTLLFNVNDDINITWTNATARPPTNETYTGLVTAVLKEVGGFSFGGPSDTGVYIPTAQAQSFFGTDECNMIVVKLKNSDKATIDNVSKAIEDTFDGEVSVISSTAVVDILSGVFSVISLFLVGIAAISLLVAGIGIMNIMIVSLIERTREIGILKALGMKSRTVLTIFLSESVIIGLIGAVIGIVLGWGLANVVAVVLSGGGLFQGVGGNQAASRIQSGYMTITPVLTPTVLVGALLFGIGVSVIFALYPAWRASKLKPVEALRYE